MDGRKRPGGAEKARLKKKKDTGVGCCQMCQAYRAYRITELAKLTKLTAYIHTSVSYTHTYEMLTCIQVKHLYVSIRNTHACTYENAYIYIVEHLYIHN